MPTANKKYVAWGASPIFEIYAGHANPRDIEYCVDSSPEKQGREVEGVPICPPERLFAEDKESVVVVNFGHSSAAIQSINQELCAKGFVLGMDHLDFADFAKQGFCDRAAAVLRLRFNPNYLAYARSFNFNSTTSLETTVLGNWLLLELVKKTRGLPGSIAEVGAFKGGNALLLLNAMSLWDDERRYYVLDSFAGFDKLTAHDPIELQNAYDYDYNFDLIVNAFSPFGQSRVVKGYVPSSFIQIPEQEKFSIVFYDCDLYQPALDTYDFFWDRIQAGGYLVIHDSVATKDGWNGVKQATGEYFANKNVVVHDFWETTMSVIEKK